MREAILSRWFVIWTVLLAVDQVAKFLAVRYLKPGDVRMPFIPGFIELQYAQNIGAAFSILPGKTTTLIGIALFTIAMICGYLALYKDDDGPLLKTGLTLILAGTVGNLIDRATHQYVIDHFHFVFPGLELFPIFNFADIFIDAGVALLIIDFLMDVVRPKPTENEEPPDPSKGAA